MVTEEYKKRLSDDVQQEQQPHGCDDDELEAYSLGYLVSLANGASELIQDDKLSCKTEPQSIVSDDASYEEDDGLSYLIALTMTEQEESFTENESLEEESVSMKEGEGDGDMKLQEFTEPVVEEQKTVEKVVLSSVYGKMGTDISQEENHNKTKVGMILDGEHL